MSGERYSLLDIAMGRASADAQAHDMEEHRKIAQGGATSTGGSGSIHERLPGRVPVSKPVIRERR